MGTVISAPLTLYGGGRDKATKATRDSLNRLGRTSAGEGGEDFGSLNLWLTKQLHHLAAEFWQGV